MFLFHIKFVEVDWQNHCQNVLLAFSFERQIRILLNVCTINGFCSRNFPQLCAACPNLRLIRTLKTCLNFKFQKWNQVDAIQIIWPSFGITNTFQFLVSKPKVCWPVILMESSGKIWQVLARSGKFWKFQHGSNKCLLVGGLKAVGDDIVGQQNMRWSEGNMNNVN
jgi:hypothetical protein